MTLRVFLPVYEVFLQSSGFYEKLETTYNQRFKPTVFFLDRMYTTLRL